MHYNKNVNKVSKGKSQNMHYNKNVNKKNKGKICTIIKM